MSKEYFENLLRTMVERKASDLHLKTFMPPVVRINEAMTPLENLPKQTPDILWSTIKGILSEDSYQRFTKENELDFAYSLPQVGRFRVNIFIQRGTPVIVARSISLKIPKFEDLALPAIVQSFAEKDRGIVLVTGTTGSGKSTTLASLIDIINSNKQTHIISIEDPIEFLHPDKKSIVNQREVGLDTKSFATALKHLLRQDPDVILIGEIRDSATMDIALGAADTGHLVFSTLHTTDARQTIERIINFFPLEQSNHVRLHLSLNLAGIVCQRLLPRSDKPGMIPAVEVMINTARIRQAIAENKVYEITKYIAEGDIYGMQTFNQSLYQLVKDNFISEETALSASSAPEELRMQLRGIFSNVTENKKGRELTTGMASQSRIMQKGEDLIFDEVPAIFDSAVQTENNGNGNGNGESTPVVQPKNTPAKSTPPSNVPAKNTATATKNSPPPPPPQPVPEKTNDSPLLASKMLTPMQIQQIIRTQGKNEYPGSNKTQTLVQQKDEDGTKKKFKLF